jgi:hypothetical protein
LIHQIQILIYGPGYSTKPPTCPSLQQESYSLDENVNENKKNKKIHSFSFFYMKKKNSFLLNIIRKGRTDCAGTPKRLQGCNIQQNSSRATGPQCYITYENKHNYHKKITLPHQDNYT